MRFFRRIFIFLGGIHFAITLILFTAVFVIAGTILESATESHRYASLFTYSNPAFQILLALFFVNILFSALRRWPFQKKHIPFLVTHLGLLMLLAGTMIKTQYGTQGNLIVIEGSATKRLLIPDSYALSLQPKQSAPIFLSINPKRTLIREESPRITLTEYQPHCSERMQTFIKDNQVDIRGIRPIPFEEEKNRTVRFFSDCPAKKIIALRTDSIEDTLKKHYLSGIQLEKQERPAMPKTVDLALSFSPIHGTQEPHLVVDGSVEIPLSGSKALLNREKYDIKLEPSLLFLQETDGDLFLFCLGEHGELNCELFPVNHGKSILVYDGGYQGYALQAKIPRSVSRAEREKIRIKQLTDEIQDAARKKTTLSPPLAALKRSFPETMPEVFLDFLVAWDSAESILYPNSLDYPQLDSLSLQPEELAACYWACEMMDRIEPKLKEGKDWMTALKEEQWPLVARFEMTAEKENDALATLFLQQIFSIGKELSPTVPNKIPYSNARLLSSYLRAYGIFLQNILPEPDFAPEEVYIETALRPSHRIERPLRKLEENIPRMVLEIEEGGAKEKIALAYDRHAAGLPQPALGNYLLRFQPNSREIPYNVRLRQARQVCYPGSSQAYSYECDVSINETIEATLSMNRVYETWDGYRFYLSNLSPADQGAVKRVQIIVNHDPAKYLLTYPGAILLAAGILLLFTLQPYKKR